MDGVFFILGFVSLRDLYLRSAVTQAPMLSNQQGFIICMSLFINRVESSYFITLFESLC